MKDTIYKQASSPVKPFEFDQHVADVFPDMIKRSVPGYPLTVSMITVIADRYFQEKTRIYDLGCSLGAVVFSLEEGMRFREGEIIGVDNSPAMIDACQQRLVDSQARFNIKFVEADINQVEINNASIVIMNFTLQFIPPDLRAALLKKIYDALLPGGILILSEKIAFSDEHESRWMQELHHHMKALNGYDEMEIANKRAALEKVLIPESEEEHMQRLQQAGFQQISLWLRCLNFISLLAIK